MYASYFLQRYTYICLSEVHIVYMISLPRQSTVSAPMGFISEAWDERVESLAMNKKCYNRVVLICPKLHCASNQSSQTVSAAGYVTTWHTW